jgi:hypothetical protein
MNASAWPVSWSGCFTTGDTSWATSQNQVVERNQHFGDQHILYHHACDVTGCPECPVYILAQNHWHCTMKASGWSQMFSLEFQLAFVWPVNMCHKAPNPLMSKTVTAAKIFLSFNHLICVTEQKDCVDNISKDTGRRERTSLKETCRDLWDLKFLQQCWWWFKSSGMLHDANW